MSLDAPAFLLLLLLIPAGYAAARVARSRRRRYALRFPATATVAAVLDLGSQWRRYVPPALLALAVATLALALARPEKTVAVPIEEASVALISDASGSMAATDVSPSRLDAARKAALTFLDKVPGELRVGLVGFSSSPHTVLRPTLDRETLAVTLGGLQASGGTATGDALSVALDTLAPEEGSRKRPPAAIILLSDGKTTEGVDPVEVAREAARRKIPIYTVALGTPDGVVPGGPAGYVPVPPDPETLREIANVSRGQAFEVDDSDELQGVYEKLGSSVGTRDEQREITAGFAGGALVLLLAAFGSAVYTRGRHF